ncbi:[protein-PII] uridylyltransferase [Actinocatenispora sera]|uniref:[protein-PII] uridylyltransferase n=1 Tax=Actinocatenispora sera TaxID=390989 RepID=UPI00340BBDCF
MSTPSDPPGGTRPGDRGGGAVAPPFAGPAGARAVGAPARPGGAGAPPRTAGIGPAARAARAARLDGWLAGLLPRVPGVALLALGGLGRRECLERTDLDLLIVHSGHGGIGAVADAVWYPVWDAGLRLDHAVRTVPELLAVGAEDAKAALGLLDARYVAGDRALAERVRAAIQVSWRRGAATRLAALHELDLARWERYGELANQPESDLKQARGGLRDAVVLRGIAFAQLVPGSRRAALAAQRRLLTVREALHQVAGRPLDRLVADLAAPVAARLVDVAADLAPDDRPLPPHGDETPDDPSPLAGCAPGDRQRMATALAVRVADDARTIAYALDDAWRSVRRSGSRPYAGRRRGGGAGGAGRRPLDDGVVEQDGEVVLARAALAPDRPDPALPLRAVGAAARAGLPIAAATLEWLGAACPAPPQPWPEPVRRAFLRLLGAGPGLVPAWEAADRYGLVERWIPEWSAVRSLPQPGPVHRHTVDRHLVQTVVCATAAAHTVARPDLLLTAALLHDVGKGSGRDHAAAGAVRAERIAVRMGFPAGDVATLVRLVRWHLLLPEVATRRDLADPVTIAAVADTVGEAGLLDLLTALTVADATAAGPVAASVWRLGLIDTLARRVRAALDTGALPTPGQPSARVRALAGGPLPAIEVEPDRVRVAAAAGTDLLAAVAGCLAAHRLTVLSADVTAVPSGPAPEPVVAVECLVHPDFGTAPDPARLAAELRRALRGELPVAERLAARERGYARSGPAVAPTVLWHDGAATDAVVLEVRAADRIGLLYRLARSIAAAGGRIRAARIGTLGAVAVDTFYLVGTVDRARIGAAVAAAAAS